MTEPDTLDGYIYGLEQELAEAKAEIAKLRAIVALHVAVGESRRQMIESLIADLGRPKGEEEEWNVLLSKLG
jgi:hypothetical protein